ncbi:MAG: hypothetical protein P9F19_18340 [Candidatus Contendobacter sp.]|nr:hypothetical protein [Candidatus Contendobacter sp.]MDG4559327.1 hypothetical protein [Candidatus Contendobacter sp.]
MQFARMVLTAALIAATGAVLAQDRRPDARLAFSSTAFGLVFGYQSGQGALEFQGRKYPFTVSGIKAATLGISKVDALGQVYRLRELADFPGRYIVVEGGLTVVQGGGNAVLRNEKGVMLYLQNVQYGLDLTLGGGGVDIALVEPAAGTAPATAPGVSAR